MRFPLSRALCARLCLDAVLIAALCATASCRRQPRVADETYRAAVTAFYVSLAAMQTSQDVLARRELDRLTQQVPQEPAGWANLGLLLLRQQQLDDATVRLTRASDLAPRSAAIARLQALAEGRKGNLDASMRHWRRAMELDPADANAPYALAQELERAGSPANEAEAQRLLEGLAGRTGNLAAELEYARLAAKRGDAAALQRALEALTRKSPPWPEDARERLNAVRQSASGNAASAATPVIFLKNVLLRSGEYRAAFAAVSTPNSEVGEPLDRFIVLPTPPPQPAAADEQLTFSAETSPAVPLPSAVWAGVSWLTGEGPPVLLAAAARELRVGSAASIPLPAGALLAGAGPDSVVAVDLNYDFRTDLVIAGTGGVQFLRQN